jgi:hypothetical protein
MAEGEARSIEGSYGARLWWLILGRAVVALLVLVAGVLWARGTFGANIGNSLQAIKPLIIVVALLTLLYSVAHLIWRNYIFRPVFSSLATWCWLPARLDHRRRSFSLHALLYRRHFGGQPLLGPRGALITSIGSAAAFNTVRCCC